MIPEIRIEDFNYPLTEDRIAKYPLEQRDSSKLLIYRNGRITDTVFRNIASYLPENSIIVFNDTKVVPARLHFRRKSGAKIEIFCLKPYEPIDYALSFSSTSTCAWRCVIGNGKRWKGDCLDLDSDNADAAALNLHATLLEREGETGFVKFTWDGSAPFSRVLEICGNVPIPPYLNRDTEEIDVHRYQTLYAKFDGSVAAPTAGLHFTEETLSSIRAKGILEETVCLHVGAGTFLPVKTSSIAGHVMHREPFSVSRDFLESLLGSPRKVIAVGTTSVRTLESLYYVGVSCIEDGAPADVEQWVPYTREYPYSTREALQAIVRYMDENSLVKINVETRIIIVPGFKFRIVDVLVTNFHQPESTLILLVSAFVNGDWRRIYDYALSNGFRFLSYGDSNLLFRE